MEKSFVDDLTNITRLLISAPVIYILVIASVRLLGKRTTSQMNSFDWIVTVAMGSLGGINGGASQGFALSGRGRHFDPYAAAVPAHKTPGQGAMAEKARSVHATIVALWGGVY